MVRSLIMLKNIRLSNYKCFNDSRDIEIKPLTVLCGVNSSGKSTIMKSLLTLKQTYENAGDKKSLILNSSYVKNGTCNDILYKRIENNFCISSNFIITKASKNDYRSRSEITAFKNIAKMYSNHQKIQELDLCCKSVFRKNTNEAILIEQNYEIEVRYSTGSTIKTVVSYKKDRTKWDISISNFPNNNGEIIPTMELYDVVCYFENFRFVNLYVNLTTPQTDEVVYIVNNLCTISRYAGNLFNTFKYLTPLRVYPQRTYLGEDDTIGVGIGGENTAQFLNDNGEKTFKGLPFGVLSKETSSKTLNEYVNLWMNYFGIGSYNIQSNNDIIRLNIESDNIINVGFGVSQALPIIVSGLTMNIADTLFLEQPEIHLHPKAQMAMGDFLVSMAKAGKGVLVETHSDHIINRIVKRVMDGTIGCDEVAIYFVNNNQDGSTITKVEIDMIKGIVNAPQEFFTQFASELSEIFNIGLKNLKRQRENI